ncbi:hypothetical protein KAFR_0E03300 [Kazachstania africana CBS 2517]|uniref:Association with the SNF1 complex (ASC) domain-containing protein n=1 Tax=Kazachstania africana (strain ATCC 22294 / BCRC 22015 / CBS 2517 / CECT 1963 / NBRC 1671 / NRRL Y-8276) TaxID=1071382 RepID=H2AVT2_KAZAF|nr:hypothetical protein KAFR_0E03300 [Kazachstania africana CBS 2517]CCF58482.1 hypothetical protein KAFR_0E03300 [Kazachstania africana CBS 2517]
MSRNSSDFDGYYDDDSIINQDMANLSLESSNTDDDGLLSSGLPSLTTTKHVLTPPDDSSNTESVMSSANLRSTLTDDYDSINQSTLQNVMKRKRSEQPMSQTAKTMLKLYGNSAEREREQEAKNASLLSLPNTKKFKNESAGTDSDVDDDNDDVEVILKWREPIDHNSAVAIVSKDIVSTLLTIAKTHKSSIITFIERKKFKINLLYDIVTNEWYLPNLFLPPGIYKLQFLINGNLIHSNYLPTATNANGNIVNWFEVICGYKTIEPYRDEERIIHREKSTANESISSNSLTDYAGISRSSSIVSNKSSLISSSLKLTNLNLNDDEIKYTNEIPEIFKFDSTANSNVNNQAFDMSLSKVIDLNQDHVFASLQKIARMNTDEAENYFLNRFKIHDLPIYLNSNFLNKIFIRDNNNETTNNTVPHVNLNHLLTTSIKDDTLCVACTTRYVGKFITQIMYAPSSPTQSD